MFLRLKRLLHASCPRCGSIDLRSVGPRTRFNEKALWLMKSFRCCLCGRNVFLFRWQMRPDKEAALSGYVSQF